MYSTLLTSQHSVIRRVTDLTQIVFCLVFCTVWLAGVAFASPFREAADNVFSTLCQVQLFFVLLACLISRFGKEMAAAVNMLELCSGRLGHCRAPC